MMLRFARSESELIQEATFPFIKDLLDLFTEASEAVDAYREMLADFMNLYNTAVSNRMNDIMKVLTVFAAIFIPLTFIAGIYGTNFEHIPELHYKYSYFFFWAVMIGIALTMLLYFKQKKWF
jgi:magnesium transporter